LKKIADLQVKIKLAEGKVFEKQRSLEEIEAENEILKKELEKVSSLLISAESGQARLKDIVADFNLIRLGLLPTDQDAEIMATTGTISEERIIQKVAFCKAAISKMDGNSFYLLNEVITRLAAFLALKIRLAKDKKIKIEKTKEATETSREKNAKPPKQGVSSMEKLEQAFLSSSKGLTNSQLKEFMSGVLNNDMAKAILKMAALGIPLANAKNMVCGATK
jgi:hypothetical protein